MKKILSWTAVGIMALGALGACSSDKKSPSTTTASDVTTATTAAGDDTATTAAGDGTETTAASSGDSSAAADKFCADVTALVEKGPTASDYATKLQELIAQGTTLAAAAASDPTVSAKLQECVTKLTPGG